MKIILSSFGTYYSLNQAKLFHENGTLVKYITGDPEKYIDNQQEIPIEKIKYFYKNPKINKKMGENAFKTVKNNYTANDYRDRWQNILNTLAKENK